MGTVIHTDRLCKEYGSVRAVRQVSLHVNHGEIYGFLGLNGAGKTTTIRMLLGMIRPTSGEAYLCGRKVHPDDHDLWRKVGYLVEIPYSYPDLTVRENLEMVRRLRQLENPRAVDEVMSKLKLDVYRDRKAKQLSLGNMQRLGLAKALLHQPDILLLDEPSNGLDPAGIVEIRQLLLDLAHNHGVTIFISSHILGEVSKIAGRIGIIHQGKLVQEMDAKRIDTWRKQWLVVNAADRNTARRLLEGQGYTVEVSGEGELLLHDERACRRPDAISAYLAANGCPPTMLVKREEDLEEYFFRVIDGAGGALE